MLRLKAFDSILMKINHNLRKYVISNVGSDESSAIQKNTDVATFEISEGITIQQRT